jgi:hypothetical protein
MTNNEVGGVCARCAQLAQYGRVLFRKLPVPKLKAPAKSLWQLGQPNYCHTFFQDFFVPTPVGSSSIFGLLSFSHH